MTKEKPSEKLGLERIAFFSDAVMAIAITLLVIELQLPEHNAGTVFHQLFEIHPKLTSYVISFCVIALFWEAHHRMFTYFRRYDRGLVWLNIFFLMFLGLLPFTTGILGEHAANGQALVLYSVNVAAIGIFRCWIWFYASRKQRLVDADLSAAARRLELWRGLSVPFVFLLSIPVALSAPAFASLCWLLIVPVSVAGRKWIAR